MKPTRRQQIAKVYAQVPRIECKGLCFDSCGPIGMTPIEKFMLDNAAGHEVKTVGSLGLTCSALTADKKCSAYEERPLICRLWGVAQGMICEHGCEILDNDGKPLNFAEAAYLNRQMDLISPGGPVWTADPELLAALAKSQSPEETLSNIFAGRNWDGR